MRYWDTRPQECCWLFPESKVYLSLKFFQTIPCFSFDLLVNTSVIEGRAIADNTLKLLIPPWCFEDLPSCIPAKHLRSTFALIVEVAISSHGWQPSILRIPRAQRLRHLAINSGFESFWKWYTRRPTLGGIILLASRATASLVLSVCKGIVNWGPGISSAERGIERV